MNIEKNYAYKKTVSKILFSFLIIGLIGCSSPEEKAKKYIEKGNKLLAEGNPEKAKIEFKNALQLKKTSIDAVYGLALAAEKQSNWQEEYALLSEVILKNPKHLEAYIKYGELLLAANEIDKANEAGKKLMELNKEDPSVLTFMAGLSLKKKDTESTVKYANEAIAKNPKQTNAYLILASERMIAKDTPKALEFLDQGLKTDSKNLAIQLMKINILETTAQFAQVETGYKELIGNYPEAVGFRKMYATFLFRQDRKQDAETQLRKIAELQPKDINPKLDIVRFVNQVKGPAAGRQELETFAKNEPDNFDLKFALFNVYQNLRDNKAADSLLMEIIESQKNEPNGLKAKGFLAVSYLGQNKKEEAVKLIDEVLEKDARNEQALTLKAGMEIDNRDFDSAVAHLRSILRDNPNSTRTLAMLARVHDITGDYALAEEHYVRALKASNNSPEYGLDYVSYLIKRNQLDRAEKVVQEILDSNKNDLRSLKALAQIKIMKGDYAGAQEIADKLKNVSGMTKLSEQINGAVQYGQKNYEAGIESFKRIYEATPDDKSAINDLVASYMVAGKVKEAKALLNEKLSKQPDNLEIALLLAHVHIRAGEKNEAIDLYKNILNRNPNSTIAYRELVSLYLQGQQKAEAQNIVSLGLKSQPQDIGLKLDQAGIYELDAKFDDAIKVYEEVLKLRPDADIVANNLASLISDNRSDKDSLKKAYEMSQRLKQSESPYFKDTFGWAAYKIGKYDEALNALNEVVAALPEVAIFQYHLGMAELAKGDKTKAKASLEKALQLSKGGIGLPADEVKKTISTL